MYRPASLMSEGGTWRLPPVTQWAVLFSLPLPLLPVLASDMLLKTEGGN
jgi:hypothetical protein